MKITGLLLTVATCCFAQVQFSGIVSGWMQDPPTQSIRLINGMPGAALLGRQVISDLAWASTAPGSGSIAIALRNGEAGESLLLRGEVVKTIEGSALAGVPQLAVWTPDAKTAVLLWSDTRMAQIVRISGDNAHAGPQFAIDNLPEGGAISAAVAGSDAVYFAITGSGGIFKTAFVDDTSMAAADLLLPAVDCQVLAVQPEGAKLWTVDRISHALIELSTSLSNSDNGPAVILSDAEVLSDISALQISTDRKSLYVANAASRRLYKLNLESRTVDGNPAELDVAARMMTPLTRPATFLLGVRGSAQEPVYLWDEVSGNVFFVPNGGEIQ
jgi:hypothetical protein